MKNILFLITFCSLFIIVSSTSFAGDKCSELLDKASKTVMLLSKRTILEKAVKICPDNPEINYQYAYCLERLRKYDEATTYYRKAVKLDKEKKSAKELFGLGDVCRMTGNLQEAVSAYEAGLRIEPGNKRAQASLREVKAALVASGKPVKTPPPAAKTPAEKKVDIPVFTIAKPYNAAVDLKRMETNLRESGTGSMKWVDKAVADLRQKQQIDRKTWK